MIDLKTMGQLAKKASKILAQTSNEERNAVLARIIDKLTEYEEELIAANQLDIQAGREHQLNEGTIDRLMINESRIKGMCVGIEEVMKQPDPIHQILSEDVRPSSLEIKVVSVPLGVIGMIFESRPNVTVDAAALALKSGNAVILRGGKEAINTNMALVRVMKEALKEEQLDTHCIQLIEDTDRSLVDQMLKMNEFFDVVIPRGGKSLIDRVVQNATVPVIQTGTGNNTIYVDKSADLDKALSLIENAKCQRISVCNCIENLLIHRLIANELLPKLVKQLQAYPMTYYGDETVCSLIDAQIATPEIYACEFLDYKLAIKVVDSIDEVLNFIELYGTHHSECILAQDPQIITQFLNGVDAAAVYVNASTRFSDGFEYGLGCEIGISTQKLHARGPMGLKALTTIQYQATADYLIRQ